MNTPVSPINVSRLRSLPKSYSWVDHRLVHANYLKHISADASTMYLFLVTVSDRYGMSYYSDRAILKRININDIYKSREELITSDLISYARPIYQVLSLKERVCPVKNKNTKMDDERPGTKEEIKAIFNKFYEDF